MTEPDSETSVRIRQLLGRGLGRQGFHRCLLDEDEFGWLSVVKFLFWSVVVLVLAGSLLVILFSITDALHVVLLALIAPGAVLAAAGIFTMAFPRTGIALWLVLGIVEGLVVSWDTVLISHVAPLAAVAVMGVGWFAASAFRDLDVEGLGRAAPLAIAAALLFLLIPLFTPELWEVASRLNAIRAVVIAVIVIVPLLLFIRGPIRAVLENEILPDIASRSLVDPASVSAAMTGIEKASDEPLDPATRAATEQCVTSAFENAGERQFSIAVRKTLAPDLRVTVDRDLVLLVGATTVILSLYFYSVAALAVPRDVAARWAHGQPQGPTIPLGSGIWIPTLPYLPVAGALALLATGILLALGVSEGSQSAAMASRLFGKRLASAWLLAVPYCHLRFEVLARERVVVTEEVREFIERSPGITMTRLLSEQADRRAAPTREVLDDLRDRDVIVIEAGRVGVADPGPGMEAIPSLVAEAQDAGTRVTMEQSGDGRPVPRLVGSAAHHLLTQLLTSLANDGSSEDGTAVFLERADDALTIRVESLTSPTAWSLRNSVQALGGSSNYPRPKDSWATHIRLSYAVPTDSGAG